MSNSRKQEKDWKVFLKGLIGPFEVCRYHKVDTFIWFMFTLVASQLGTIINVINRVVFMGWDFQVALCPESASGTFYTFALVMISSLLCPLFMSIIRAERPTFNKLRMVFVTILFFLLIMAAVLYAFSTQNIDVCDYSKLKNKDVVPDLLQLAFFIITVLAAIYAFGLTHLPEHKEEYAILSDEYQEAENAEVEHMRTNYSEQKDDGEGVLL